MQNLSLTQVAELFKALGNLPRLTILRLLLDEDVARCVTWIMVRVGAGQSETSRHLLFLEKVGLVSRIKSGKQTLCCISESSRRLLESLLYPQELCDL